jgi:hypothetical protein
LPIAAGCSFLSTDDLSEPLTPPAADASVEAAVAETGVYVAVHDDGKIVRIPR